MSMPRNLNLLSGARSDFAESIAKSKDRIVSEAISRCIGDNWSLDEIEGRCHTSNVPGTNYEVFYIDNRPIVQIDKPSFNEKRDGLSNSLVSELKYRFVGNDCRQLN